jgi:alkylated DNA nucleotide flippase Atl1
MASAAFARILRDVSRVVACVRPGTVTTYAAIGELLDLPARHVAYALSQSAKRDEPLPWHRVTGNSGELQKSLAKAQAERLCLEGVPSTAGATGLTVADFSRFYEVPTADGASLEATTRPPQYRQEKPHRALADTPGLGERGLEKLVQIGITRLSELQNADPYRVYERIKRIHPRTQMQLLFVLIAASEGRDWREVATSERTAALLRLDDMNLL